MENHTSDSLLEALWGCDSSVIEKRMSLEESTRLFEKDVDRVEIWQFPNRATNCTTTIEQISPFRIFTINGLGMLQQFWQNETCTEQDTFYILRQTTTWGQISLTEETFRALISRHSVFAFFRDAVHAFGLRTKEENSTWGDFHWRWSGQKRSEFEICYIIRFFEKNERHQGDPWSLRKVGIYQKVNCVTGQSIWILVQPSAHLQDRLTEKLDEIVHDELCQSSRNILLHMAIIFSSLVNWKEYIEKQASAVEMLEEKAAFSQADYRVTSDYTLRFTDRQKLNLLRRKLLKAKSLLKSAIQLGQLMKKLCNDSGFSRTEDIKGALLHELDDYDAEATYHKRSVEELLQRSSDTSDLLSNILQYRAGTSTLQGTETLVRIAHQGEIDNEVAQETSIGVQSLTLVATMYLPASLLSAIFCSALVESRGGHFVVAREFWKYIVILIPMLAVTFAFVISFRASLWSSYKKRTLKEQSGHGSV